MANFNPISAFLKQVLDFIVSIVGNYGWSVIIFTLLIRLVLMPLDIQSKKSMKRMSSVQPKLNALQAKYGKDREKLAQKQQELYKKEGINPLSGCLPMLLQFPIVIMMFTAMRVVANEHTVQMLLDLKNGIEPYFQNWLWIKNVFQPDSFMATVIPALNDQLAQLVAVNGSSILTMENVQMVKEFVASPEYVTIAAQYGADSMRYSAPILMWTLSIPQAFNGLFILPLLAGASSFLSSKLLSPQQQQAGGQAGSTAQTNQMMTWMMPIISIFWCATSNAAFSIYWVFVNVIQIIQQYAINMYFDRQDTNKPEEVTQP